MLMIASIVSSLLADGLSPPSCAACSSALRESRAAFCATCASTIDRIDEPFAVGDILGVAVGSFGGALATAIRRLKYDDRPDLARPLGDLLGHACSRARMRVDLVAPVPLHITRLALRGYNQAALLASRVARLLEKPMHASALERTETSNSQARLSKGERLLHVANAFAVPRPKAICGKRVLVVDDVTTTGATLGACASALLRAGAHGVTASVVARTLAAT